MYYYDQMSEQTTVMSFRIPNNLRRKMKTVRKNWSLVVRQSIESEIKESKKHEVFKEIDAMLAHMPTIKKGTAAKYIRQDRDSH